MFYIHIYQLDTLNAYYICIYIYVYTLCLPYICTIYTYSVYTGHILCINIHTLYIYIETIRIIYLDYTYYTHYIIYIYARYIVY